MPVTEENQTRDEANAEAVAVRSARRRLLFILVFSLVMIPDVRNFVAQILAGKSDASLFLITNATLFGFAGVLSVTRIVRGMKYKPGWSAIGGRLFAVVFAVVFLGPMVGGAYWSALRGGTVARGVVFFLGVIFLTFGLIGRLSSDRPKFTLTSRWFLIVFSVLAFCAGFNLFSRL